jgi:voltage-gated potassium channel
MTMRFQHKLGENAMAATSQKPGYVSYEIFMLVLCVYTLVILAVEVVVPLRQNTRAVLDYSDRVVCALFLSDFVLSLVRASNRWQYLVSWGWLDLLSSIPTLEIARWGRIGRVLRILRVLRGLRATRLLANMVLRRRADNVGLAAVLIVLLLVVFCSVAVLHVESSPDSNIKTAEDAIWWSLATITTVGYGDRYPVTSEGRLIGAILMCTGVGLFGTMSGLLAAWFLAPQESSRELNLQTLQNEIVALRRLMERHLGANHLEPQDAPSNGPN